MIEYKQARKRIKKAARAVKLATEDCALDLAQGRVLAAPVLANVDLPAFDNSAMDGYALRAQTETGELRLPVVKSIAAGDLPSETEMDGAVEIMTGAPVPHWCETVVPVENVEIERGEDGEPTAISLHGPIVIDQHIRRAGEDVTNGEELLAPGRVLSPEVIMMLAALGQSNVSVKACPKVSLISTGAELVDQPNIPLQPGQIRNSNQPFLAAKLMGWPVEVDAMTGHPDTKDEFLKMLRAAVSGGSQIIISTGAVSMGNRDFVPDALAEMGAQTIFHKSRIRPGKPILFAVLPNGALFFGLPGNPISAAVGFTFFVLPALRKILGLKEPAPQSARLVNNFSKRAGLRMFAKACCWNQKGKMLVEILPGQQSFRMNPLLAANCWAEIPEDAASVEPGAKLRIHPFMEGDQC
jgi:molybdopterin molybdotransferase